MANPCPVQPYVESVALRGPGYIRAPRVPPPLQTVVRIHPPLPYLLPLEAEANDMLLFKSVDEKLYIIINVEPLRCCLKKNIEMHLAKPCVGAGALEI